MRHLTWLSDDADIFSGVTNDEAYAEAQVKKELQPEKKKLEQQIKEAEKNLEQLKEKVKIETAKKLFISKSDFLMREELDFLEGFIVKIDEHLLNGDKNGLANTLRSGLYHIQHMNTYLATPNTVDILYDYGRSSVYKKIKDNNADFNRTNKKLRNIKIRKTSWIPLSATESRDEKSKD